MPTEAPFLFRSAAVDYDGSGTIALWTDLPDDAPALRETITLPTRSGATGVTLPLRGTTKGRVCSIKITGGALLAIYRIRFYVRPLGVSGADWQWYEFPFLPADGNEIITIPIEIPPTPSEWATVPLGIPETPEQWATVPIGIPETPEHWSEVPIGIPQTAEQWSEVPIGIPPTQEAWEERTVPIPPSPEEQVFANLPMDE